MHAYRSHTCADLTKSDVGDTVRLSGWVHRIRDHGGVLFIDLRDHYGMTQLICDPDSPVFAQVDAVRSEWCIRIDGSVKARDAALVNPKLPTGEVEVFIRDIEVLGASKELPLMVFGDQEYPEETRLKHRYLDLRREAMQRNMTLRSDVVASMRRRMWDRKLPRIPDADHHRVVARGRARFSGAVAPASRQVLCASPSAAAVQAADYGVGLR